MKELNKIREFRKSLRQFERTLTYEVNCTECHDVTLSQCHILLEIEEKEKTNTGELAIALELNKSTVSRTVDGLVKNGMVERTVDPEDRRYTHLSLSAEGKEKCQEINARNDAYFNQVFKRISEEKHEGVFELFNLFIEAMKSKTDGGNCHD